MTTCCRSWSPGWTTSSTGPAWPGPAARPASWSATATSWSTATRSNIPSYRVTPLDIIDVKPKSLETTPFLIARETLGERPVPAWLQVIPSKLRILVHQLPERAQIEIPLTEQLIVELYSK